jgi:hypothetical protein
MPELSLFEISNSVEISAKGSPPAKLIVAHWLKITMLVTTVLVWGGFSGHFFVPCYQIQYDHTDRFTGSGPLGSSRPQSKILGVHS